MSESEVIEIMGIPARTQFSGDGRALHYCKTDIGADEFAVVILNKGKVVSAYNYSVNHEDTGGV